MMSFVEINKAYYACLVLLLHLGKGDSMDESMRSEVAELIA